MGENTNMGKIESAANFPQRLKNNLLLQVHPSTNDFPNPSSFFFLPYDPLPSRISVGGIAEQTKASVNLAFMH